MNARNRAKCRICEDTIESFEENDAVKCSCGMIVISGGPAKFLCAADDFDNFIRIDDAGNEIAVKYEEKVHEDEGPKKNEEGHPKRVELLNMLEAEVKYWDKLPQDALYQPVRQVDHYRLASLILEIFRAS